jgi:hypothetical protein
MISIHDHQFQIDRRPTHLAVERRDLFVQMVEIQHGVEPTQKVICGHSILKQNS